MKTMKHRAMLAQAICDEGLRRACAPSGHRWPPGHRRTPKACGARCAWLGPGRTNSRRPRGV